MQEISMQHWPSLLPVDGAGVIAYMHYVDNSISVRACVCNGLTIQWPQLIKHECVYKYDLNMHLH